MGTASPSWSTWTGSTDHPHGRGDGSSPRRSCGSTTGSPPRAWGRRYRAGGITVKQRITPTGVGTAIEQTDTNLQAADHPHGRGDGWGLAVRAGHAAGSPPRAWGRRMAGQVVTFGSRITPTGVGTARCSKGRSTNPADHPHGRGDGVPVGQGILSADGSPPRAWGRRACPVRSTCQARITPTGVGTARHGRGNVAAGADHPHGRGDGERLAGLEHQNPGSPPRAWGRRSGCSKAARHLRITPTGVGTAPRRYRRSRRSADHPHGRGDGPPEPRTLEDRSGSPPRAWGRPDSVSAFKMDARITPTGVGTARQSCRLWRRISDHPHGRGDGT